MFNFGQKKTKELILHVGPPKTGTTSIQHYLHSSKEELQNRGILYPDSIENASYPTQHADIANLISRRDLNTVKQYKKKIEAEANRLKCNYVILSSENFAGFTKKNIWSEIYELFSPFNITTYYTSRKPGEQVKSDLYQRLEGNIGLLMNYSSIEECVHDMLRIAYSREHFFRELGAEMIDYHALTSEDNLCAGFLDMVTGVTIESPEIYLNKRERKFSQKSIFWTYSLRKMLSLLYKKGVDSRFTAVEARKVIQSITYDEQMLKDLLNMVDEQIEEALKSYKE